MKNFIQQMIYPDKNILKKNQEFLKENSKELIFLSKNEVSSSKLNLDFLKNNNEI